MEQFFTITPKTEPDRVAQVKPREVRDKEFVQYTQALQAMAAVAVMNNVFTASQIFNACAKQYGNKVCLREVSSDRSFTYTEVNFMANRVARWARAQGLKQRDVVALMMENSPEFLWTSIGLIRAGCVPALINTNLEGDRLAHSVQISLAPIAIVSVKYAKQWERTRDNFAQKGFRGKVIWAAGATPPEKIARSDLIDYQLRTYTPYPNPPTEWEAGMTLTDPAYYIYTSGTTGNSKAVRLPHAVLFIYMGVSQFLKLTKDDVYYNCLPLYHSAGTLGSYTSFYKGATVVLREKFSPSNFWKDIKKFQCTAMVYIGELWTYLLKQPVRPEERNNTLTKINGNGLRGHVWSELETRFQIKTIVEYFGQTEYPTGRAPRAITTVQSYGKQGSCGYIPQFVLDDPSQDMVLLEFDIDANKPRRYGADQLCRRVERGSPGLCVVELNEEHKDDLYTTKSASRRPLLSNIFKKGDKFYSTGDLLRVDEEGFVFFVDRTGDTFRWKGENVSTNEVCAIMSTFPSILEANVYGVTIPSNPDGRAGMASVTVKPGHTLDIPALRAHCQTLPSYAQPVFLRVSKSSEFEKTSTLKFQKTKFQADAFDPAKCSPDEIWYSDRNAPYVRMNATILAQLMRTPSKL